MSIHKKLLIVLLIVALPPLLIISLFDHHMTTRLAETLTSLRQDIQTEQAIKSLRQIVDGYGVVLDRDRRLAEVSLAAQAWELENRIKDPIPAKEPAKAKGKSKKGTKNNDNFPSPPLNLVKLFATPLELTPGASVESFENRQVMLPNGVHIDLSSGRVSGANRRPGKRWKDWFDTALGQDGPLWTTIAEGAGGGPGALLVSMPIHRQDGTSIALTTVRISAQSLVETVKLPKDSPQGINVLLVNPSAGKGEPATLLAMTPQQSTNPTADRVADHVALARMQAIAQAFAMASTGTNAGVGKIDIDGVALLLIFGPAGRLGPQLVLVVPENTLVSSASPGELSALRRVDQQIIAGGMALILLLVIGAALSFIAARSITQPIEALALVAGRLAEGDMDARAEIHTGDEMEELGDAFNAMLPKLQDRIRMRDALSLAMEVQQKLLPASAPVIPGLDLGGISLYCDETGGDYYDFIEISELGAQRVGVAVGDVAGHGIAAALLMATARALLRIRATQAGSLSQVMTEINGHIASDSHAGRFMTLFYGVIDASRRSIRWVSAGHAPAILYNIATDQFSELAGHDIPLGVEPHWIFREDRRDGWMPGELIAIGTDGIWETRDPSGAMFGMEALHNIIRINAHLSASAICNAVAASLLEFRQGHPQNDDITLVIVKMV